LIGGNILGKQITVPSILPGFMELLPNDQMAFNKMLDIIRNTYEKYGFIPLDTPTIEKSEILLAKSGGETEKQIYRFKGDNDLSLRFDLTVPLARYVAQHYNELTFPFRRYHIGKVFRGERPQKGRFREFYQCDIDIIGNEKLSIINDAEILSVIYSTFKALGFDEFTIRINNRKVLNGFFESLAILNKYEVLRVVDKFDKIGEQAVAAELQGLGLGQEAVSKVLQFIKIKGEKSEVIEKLKGLQVANEMFLEGLVELGKVCEHIKSFGIPDENTSIDLTIARGLDYYTGTIYETILNNYPSIGSVCSGGRYDDLAQNYTEKKLPGVGISIGLTRLFYQLREAEIIKIEKRSTPTKLLVIPMDGSIDFSLDLATKARTQEISTEIYLNDGKMAKKITYANKLGIPYVVVIGENETKSGLLKLKNMDSGEQVEMTVTELIEKLREYKINNKSL
jgi:histidyl-tRNA synthetase